jgi:sulfite reductase alpha subunit-like flavoprotein
MAKNWEEYLTENNVIITETTVELMVDKCIKEGKSKKEALSYAKNNEFPKTVHEILNRLPKSFFECFVAADENFETLMEDYEGDLTQMIDDYLTEDEEDLTNEEYDEDEDYSNKFDEEEDLMDDEDEKKKKKKVKDDSEEDEDDEDDDDDDDEEEMKKEKGYYESCKKKV